MTMETIADAGRLAGIARTSEDGEAYHIVVRAPHYRIGVGARASSDAPSYFVEVVIEVFREDSPPDFAAVRDALSRAEALEARGHDLRWERDGALMGERAVSATDIEREWRTVGEVLARPRARAGHAVGAGGVRSKRTRRR